MTVHERIQRLVNQLDERQAEAILGVLQMLVVEPRPEQAMSSGIGDAVGYGSPFEGHLLTSESPLWEIVGMIDDSGPNDVSENVDHYLAAAEGNRPDVARR